MLGEKRFDTKEIIGTANKILKESGYCAKTVPKDAVDDYYRCSDIFVLASMVEGFGLVYVEALLHGLPCLVHDYETSKFVLGEMGYYGNLKKKGRLRNLILNLTEKDFHTQQAFNRHYYAYNRFSWDHLKPKYLELFKRCGI
jgi:glycosyltransferase involved in cell wall biosynthesis